MHKEYSSIPIIRDINAIGFQELQFDPVLQKNIRASFSQCSDREKERFKEASCLITLSIGQPAHYGPYLASTLEKVNQSFEKCTFLMGDTLQRYTLPLMTSEDQLNKHCFYQESLMLGNEWIKKMLPS